MPMWRLSSSALFPFLPVVAGAEVAVVKAAGGAGLPGIVGRGGEQAEDHVGRAGETQAVLQVVGGLAVVGDEAVGEADTRLVRHFVKLAGTEAGDQLLDALGGVLGRLGEGEVIDPLVAPEQDMEGDILAAKDMGVGDAEVVLVDFG